MDVDVELSVNSPGTQCLRITWRLRFRPFCETKVRSARFSLEGTVLLGDNRMCLPA
jgi:hypothetical protein